MSGPSLLKTCTVPYLALIAVVLFCSSASPVSAQANFDRPGGDYSHSELPSGDPADCALTCERDRKCRSWSFRFPTGNDAGVCLLKSNVPARVASNCCISGVRGAGVVESRTRKLEIATDRAGGDYRNIVVKEDNDGGDCKAACEADNKCRAWTYARPGYAGAEARCFLKDHVKPPRRKPGFISGVVR
ncbi:MAG TPA: PAN domain-containing protein [Afipia sp.]